MKLETHRRDRHTACLYDRHTWTGKVGSVCAMKWTHLWLSDVSILEFYLSDFFSNYASLCWLGDMFIVPDPYCRGGIHDRFPTGQVGMGQDILMAVEFWSDSDQYFYGFRVGVGFGHCSFECWSGSDGKIWPDPTSTALDWSLRLYFICSSTRNLSSLYVLVLRLLGVRHCLFFLITGEDFKHICRVLDHECWSWTIVQFYPEQW